MTVAGTMSYTGKLWNLTGQFSNAMFNFPVAPIEAIIESNVYY
jgi:hypothetical protein